VLVGDKSKTMENITTTSVQKDLFIKIVISNWELQNTRLNKLLDKLTDAQLAADIAPGKNSGVYLLGHLAAVSDNMLPLLGLGEKLYPQLSAIFLTSPDKGGPEKPSIAELKTYWHAINDKLSAAFATLHADQWFEKHTTISDEDFAKEPHRNKLNILINRTNHQSYHLGQLILL